MKIFLVIPDLTQGGAERVMSELANQFVKTGNDVYLILLTDAKDFYQIDNKVVVHRLGFKNKGPIQKKLSEIKTFIRLRRLFINYKPDSVLSFMDKYNVFTVLASSFLGLNVFVSDRSNPKLINSFILQKLKRITYNKAAGIIAQTDMAKQLLYELTKNNNIHVIPNPVKNIEISNVVEREKLILNVGRLVPEKGQCYLLSSFAKIRDTTWKLAIIGSGPLMDELVYQAECLGIADRVIFTGAVENIDEWYSRASIFAFTSVSEGFPNALIEAMAAGVASISFDCDAGPRDIINNGINGVLVPARNLIEFTDNLNSLIADEELRKRLSKEAIKINKSLSVERISQLYLEAITTRI
ncbi:hypothetical protein CWE15_11880 [Aliidiomarina taiwanensis]|uniref:Glycosyltransferase family 4 protein n=1 Tax=Aliidiomarina taiwanensis TaxID=946228 RepID=A0A432WTE9_9GAMM|nr:glycosyltransferase family 4 protein [Aliidiomarina taiwanensis]RUO37050.1 hypothetical protein CWE15_11880 [Aliidiomarina taiwanensis]